MSNTMELGVDLSTEADCEVNWTGRHSEARMMWQRPDLSRLYPHGDLL